MWGLELYEQAWKKHYAELEIKEIRSKCETCKGTGSISYGVGGSGCYGYSMHQMPCYSCGYLEFKFGIGGSLG